MGVIKIRDLLLRTQVGFNSHEVGKLQDVVIHLEFSFDASVEELADDPKMALDYKVITKGIIMLVEGQKFNLLESLTRQVLDYLMSYDRILTAHVEVVKPHALRFSKSVSYSLSANRV